MDFRRRGGVGWACLMEENPHKTAGAMPDPALTTGLAGLDRVFMGIQPGDSIVWQIDATDDYQALVEPFGRAVLRSGRPLIYFRFAGHAPLPLTGDGLLIRELDPARGFEDFLADVHAAMDQAGAGTCFVFDCLSRLAADWYSDSMLASFAMLTLPRLRRQGAVAYFAVYRHYHTEQALGPIRELAQAFLETYRHRGQFFVRPVEVRNRSATVPNQLYVRRGDDFLPVTSSAAISEILTTEQWSGLASDSGAGFWETGFIRARELAQVGDVDHRVPGRARETFHTLVRMIVTRDAGMQALAERYLTLPDVLDIRRRMIGTGLVGGKTVGLLLSRAIVRQADPRLAGLLEEHDSFYVGSDVFYDFLVRSGAWPIRQKQRQPDSFLDGAEEARRLILAGDFPAHVMRQFEEMLDYFGPSPFIVRSSSLLEDNYGHAFAGTYESVFCANQGPRGERLQELLRAIRQVYASSMSESALRYRADRGILDRDEQMALLIMRVSGAVYGTRYYPQMAGVGFSFNPYAWDPGIDPQAGVIRLVFGLGTRAVNRSDDDYTRLVALNAPGKRPEAGFDEVARYAQRRMDFLDLEANRQTSDWFTDVVRDAADLPLDLFATPEQTEGVRGGGPNWVLTFDRLLEHTDFVKDLRGILQALEAAYRHPVDIEFAANIVEGDRYKINLLQCRPLQIQGTAAVEFPEVTPAPDDLILSARGAVIGQSRLARIDRLVYVSPEAYSRLPVQERHEVARILGEINRVRDENAGTVFMIGPGRWGTTSPHLGIPVSFSQISRAAILCEIVEMHETLVPDVSLGTHFLNELVERDMLYLAVFPQRGGHVLRKAFFETAANRLPELVPGAAQWEGVIRVIDAAGLPGAVSIRLAADAGRQTVQCYIER